MMGILIPVVEENKNVKDLLIATLANSPPLTTKKLHSQLKKKYSIGATYQAIHKAVASLVSQGVIARKHKVYSLNPIWVSNLSQFVDELKKSTSKYSGIAESRQEGQTQILTFTSFEKAQEFKKELQKEFFEQKHSTPPVYAGEDRHLISPLIYSERSLSLLNLVNATKAKVYLAVMGNSIVDEWCADYYRNGGVKVSTGVPCADKCEVFVIGDKIVQIYSHEKLKERLDKIYNGAGKISDVSVPQLYNDIYKKKVKIKVVITQNAELAEHIRERILGWF
jgi:hypothetical protein